MLDSQIHSRSNLAQRSLQALALSVASLLLGACAVTSPYQSPAPELPAAFDQQFEVAEPQSAPVLLWSAFGDPTLNALIARALDANHDIVQASARLHEIRALAGLAPYSRFPTLTAAADAERSSSSSRDPLLPEDMGRSDSYRAGFDAYWEIDLFGSLRNQSRAIERRVQASAAQRQQIQLSIVAEVAQAFFALRGAEARLQLTDDNLAALDQTVAVIQALERAGRGTALDLARVRAERAALAATHAGLLAERVRHQQRLAVLTAQGVSGLRDMIDADAGLPALPPLLALGTPQQWLQRRPDVLAAERELAASWADVAVEVAEFYPRLELLGGFGWTAQSLGDLGRPDAQRWRFGPSLSWSFLDRGRVRQRVRAASARSDAAAAAFEATVLRALEEAENALAGYRSANRAATELRLAAGHAGEAAELARLRFEAGADDALVLLDAERSRIDFEQRAVQAEVNRATALAALYKALAGDFASLDAASAQRHGEI